ncbi:MAG: class I SAM-dependent methyltransferase [bacterium]
MKFITKVLVLVGLLGYLFVHGFTQASAQVIEKTQIETTQTEKSSKIEIDRFLSVARKEVYQDILINGVMIKEGVKDCEIRYPNIKKILDNYKRPFTVLDIGASEGYFSIRIASEYDCTCVMIEGDNSLLLPEICRLNKPLSNLIVLEKFITPQDLKELGECEHFDVVLAFNVIHQMKNAWKETIDNLLALGDNIVIENPPPDCRTAANKEVLPLIEAYLMQNKHGKIIGQVPRYGRPGLPAPDQKYSNVYLFEMNKNVLNKPTWGSPNIRFYPINSNYKEKTLYKPRINKTIDWKKGINLWTFKHMNGVYPTKEIIREEIKRLSVFSHGDFLPWNMVVQGKNLELIDWEDNNAPGYMHNYEACLAQFDAK